MFDTNQGWVRNSSRLLPTCHTGWPKGFWLQPQVVKWSLQRAQMALINEFTYPLPQEGSLARIFFTWPSWGARSPAHFSSSSSEAAWPSMERRSCSSAGRQGALSSTPTTQLHPHSEPEPSESLNPQRNPRQGPPAALGRDWGSCSPDPYFKNLEHFSDLLWVIWSCFTPALFFPWVTPR